MGIKRRDGLHYNKRLGETDREGSFPEGKIEKNEEVG